MSQHGTIVVQNLTTANNVDYLVGGVVPGSGVQGLASGVLGSISSGTYQKQISVSGYEFYSVEYSPVGGTGVVVDNLVVNEIEPSYTGLALTIQ